jgi:predicted alpha/beta hydrolase family esterase
MAARWSASVLACQVLLAGGLTAVLGARLSVSNAALAAIFLCASCGCALLLSATPLVLAGFAAIPGRTPRRLSRPLLRALCTDALAIEAALGRMAFEPWRRPTDEDAAAAPRPVLLVHGFGCNRAVWRPLIARLRAAQIGPVRAVSLEPLLADIEAFVPSVLRQLESLKSSSGGRPVTVVTHSMGGLVARAALRRAGAGLVARLITLGAPHHGTALACCFGWPNARQMCPGSSWLAGLNGSPEDRLGSAVTTIYSLDDNYIVPAGSARLQGARVLELRGLGHLGLLSSTAVLEHIVAELLA